MKKGTAWTVIAAVFAVLLAVSFQRWANLIIDGGREMNAPLRLLNGETIYSDVYYLYGPLAPYVNAALFAGVGIHLNTLYFAGLVTAVLVVVLVFRLGEALSGTWQALVAAWAVIVLCVFKQNGNYVFPYTYAAVYGTALGLGALAALVRHVHNHRSRDMTVAGLLTGLALICKLEFGFAAIAGVLTVAVTDRRGRRMRLLARGLTPAIGVPLVTYALLLSKVPWDAIVKDTFLWPSYIPAELIYFNKTKLGLHDPWKTIRELANAVALLGILACTVIMVAAAWTARSFRSAHTQILRSRRRALMWMGGISAAVFAGSGVLLGTRWDVSPLRGLPVLCAGVVVAYLMDRTSRRDADPRWRALLVVSVYSLAVLGRVILRVPSGGAYGAYLLPAPLLLFTHLALTFYRPFCGHMPACAARARQIVLVLLVTLASASTAVIAYRYVKEDVVTLETSRGAVKMTAVERSAFDQALALMADVTRPGDYVWTAPEGSSLNFLGERRAPLRHEILTPGFLDTEGERRAIQQLEAKQVKLVLVLDRRMVEFGCPVFGRDCYRELQEWIDTNYRVVAELGRRAEGPLVRAYARR